jgi:hypothetical protein
MEMAMGNHAEKRSKYYTMNKVILIVLVIASFIGIGAFLLPMPEDNIQSGESTMTQPDNLTAMDTLEKFNDPENFLATRKSFDVAAFRKNAGDLSYYDFVREDGVHVRQIDFSNIRNEDLRGYKEEFTRPDSHYRYSTMYTPSGQTRVMGADFCRNYVKETLIFNEKGKIVERKNKEEQFLPIEKLRGRILEERKIDIYDTKQVHYVVRAKYDDKAYYDVFVINNEPRDPDLFAHLLDGVTGEFLFQAGAYLEPGIGPSAYVGYKEHLQSIGKEP